MATITLTGCSFKYIIIRTGPNKVKHLLLPEYYTKGFTYLEIQELLRFHHQESISLSTIEKHLRKLSLWRGHVERIRTEYATAAVRDKLFGNGSNIGYRTVWSNLRKRN